ncbi:hypothetical protein KKC62_01015 [Patescibacteria group bacterium]|nr:hypothetical protein [Patescibacteria group bacterium]MBU1952779.1 hypothetical protein [Patescibacteria group bacterium]
MKLNIEYSIDKDLWNYTRFFGDTGYSYGEVNKSESIVNRLPQKIQDVFHSGDTNEQKSRRILEYLRLNYKEKESEMGGNIKKINDTWKSVGNQVIYQLETFYNKKFPFDEVTAFITTNIICPYNFEKRYFFLHKSPVQIQLSTAKHELNHFMFLHYYPQLEKDLGNNNYQLLKESLTFFTNPEQSGYTDEKKLRELYMSKKWVGPDEILRSAVELLTNS